MGNLITSGTYGYEYKSKLGVDFIAGSNLIVNLGNFGPIYT